MIRLAIAGRQSRATLRIRVSVAAVRAEWALRKTRIRMMKMRTNQDERKPPARQNYSEVQFIGSRENRVSGGPAAFDGGPQPVDLATKSYASPHSLTYVFDSAPESGGVTSLNKSV